MVRRFLITALLCVFLWNLYCLAPVAFKKDSDIGQIKIFDRNDYLITHIQKSDGFFIPIDKEEQLPPNLTNLLIQIEDQRFLSHYGVDFTAKIRAIKSNIQAGRIVSGGSTITEQMIKNKYFKGKPRTVIQKLREANLALYTSVFVSKDRVIRNYLNSIYFGNNIYGIKTASYVYFEKSDLTALTEQEIITLLSILRAPSTITSNEEFFQNEFKDITDFLDIEMELPKYSFKKFNSINLFPHVTTSILKETSHIRGPSIIIKSTIDSDLQTDVRNQINYSLDLLDGHNVTNGSAYVFNPLNGEILAWQGSRGFYDDKIDGQVNVIEKKRQLGSALKPFVYLFAFINGAHPDNLIADLEKDFYQEDKEGVFRPLNYSLHEGGVITLKEALASSFNISAVRILDHLGLEKTFEFLKDLGLEFDYPSDHYGLSLALGSPDLTMRNVAETYGVLASNGVRTETSLIKSINEKEVMLDQNSKNNESLYHLYSVLSSQVSRSRSFGLSSILNTTIPFAVKTGTTKNFKDNWTFGYRPDLVVAVWVGNNDSSSMVNVSGITGAAPIWHRIVESAIKMGYVSNNSIEVPRSLDEYKKCINARCTRNEVIYQNDKKEWISDLENGIFCLEDFYISNVNAEEIQKVSKLFDFKDFTIMWCEDKSEEVEIKVKPIIIKPKKGETFYIKNNLPKELQKIIIKSNMPVEWIINGKDYEKTDTIFIEPTENKYSAEIKGNSESIDFFVEYVEM